MAMVMVEADDGGRSMVSTRKDWRCCPGTAMRTVDETTTRLHQWRSRVKARREERKGIEDSWIHRFRWRGPAPGQWATAHSALRNRI
ncbi:Os05g0347850 [Oryza sativa Japonica Group]|uniref:Os05g0347850 protein n=1 Tax=Oryza sativa subsp. japonica TaxID=39947 RepID=A0A0P0WL48_ORYSJ|nr:Os05g0347850 [Oryza sativa Japonica Group]